MFQMSEGYRHLIGALLHRAYLDDDFSFLLCEPVITLIHGFGISEDLWREKVMPTSGWITLYYVKISPEKPVEMGEVLALDRETTYRLKKSIPETNGRIVIHKSGQFQPFSTSRLGAIEKARGRLNEHIANDEITISGLEDEIAACQNYLVQLDCLQHA